MKPPELNTTRGGWELTRWETDIRGLVSMTIEKGVMAETFEACHFGDGPDADPVAWAAELAEKRQAFRPKKILEAS